MRFVRALAIPILIASLAGTVAACGGEPAASGDVVKIGTTESAPEWDVFKRKAAEQVRDLSLAPADLLARQQPVTGGLAPTAVIAPPPAAAAVAPAVPPAG